MNRCVLVVALCALPLLAQKYSGPRPPKPDILYLLHADNLTPTDVAEAKQESRKDGDTYTIAGANASAKTPMASPIFLLHSEKLDPSRLQLYKLESKGAQREIRFPKKKGGPVPIRIEVTRLSQDNIYRIEVDESLENGEYSLTPEGSNDVFCFQVY